MLYLFSYSVLAFIDLSAALPLERLLLRAVVIRRCFIIIVIIIYNTTPRVQTASLMFCVAIRYRRGVRI